MNFKQYQQRSYTAIQPHDNDKDELLNWAIGLAEETGEVMNIIKHHCWGGEKIDKLEMAKEIGDVLWYASALARVVGLDFQSIAELNVSKLEHRFGGEFSDAKSKQRKNKEIDFKETSIYKAIEKRLHI